MSYKHEIIRGEVYIDDQRLFIPRDSQFTPVSLLYGLDSTGGATPLSVDATGGLKVGVGGIVFEGEVTLGAVEIKDTSTNLHANIDADSGKNAMYVQSESLASETTLSGIKTQTDKFNFDASGNVNVNLSNGDIEIGAVEIKNATTDDRVNVEADNTKNAMYVQSESLATENTLSAIEADASGILSTVNNIQAQTDKLTFDGINLDTVINNTVDVSGTVLNNIETDVSGILINTGNAATEITVSAIKDQTDKLSFDASGNLEVLTISGLLTLIVDENETAGIDVSGVGYSHITSFGINKQINLIAVNFSTGLSKNFTVSIIDTTNNRKYAIQSQTSWSGQNAVLYDPIKLSNNMEIIIECSATSGTSILYYRVEAEAI